MTVNILDLLKQTGFLKRHIHSGSLIICCCFSVLLVNFPGPLFAEATQFYDDLKRGWFWYEEPVYELEPEELSLETLLRPIPDMSDYTVEDLWDMHPDDFQELLMDFQKKAVQVPSEQNVLEYMTMQDVARRKAAAYANVASYVIQKYSGLDVGRDYPITAPGVVARVKMQKQEITTTIRKAGSDHALLYFTSSECPYCIEQQQILRFFSDRYGWQVKGIDFNKSPGIAARFNVEITPTLLLISKNREDYMPVATGVVALDELERRLYRAIRLLNGEISPQEYSVYDFQKGGSFDPESILQ